MATGVRIDMRDHAPEFVGRQRQLQEIQRSSLNSLHHLVYPWF